MHDNTTRQPQWGWQYFADMAAACREVGEDPADVLRVDEVLFRAFVEHRRTPKATQIFRAEQWLKEVQRRKPGLFRRKAVQDRFEAIARKAEPQFRIVRTPEVPTADATEIAVKAAELTACIHTDDDTRRWLAEQITLLVAQHVREQRAETQEEVTHG